MQASLEKKKANYFQLTMLGYGNDIVGGDPVNRI